MSDNSADEILAGIVTATAQDLFPRVVMTTSVGATKISIVEPVMPREDGPGLRGYIWHAVTGSFELCPARIQNGRAVPGLAVGGTIVSHSRRSPRAAAANARAVLAARARTARNMP